MTNKNETHKQTRCDDGRRSLFSILERKSGSRRRKITEFAADHVICDLKRNVFLTVVNLELETNKVGQNSARTSIGSDRGFLFSGLTQW